MKPTATRHEEEESRRGQKVRSLGGSWALPTDRRAGRSSSLGSFSSLRRLSAGVLPVEPNLTLLVNICRSHFTGCEVMQCRNKRSIRKDLANFISLKIPSMLKPESIGTLLQRHVVRASPLTKSHVQIYGILCHVISRPLLAYCDIYIFGCFRHNRAYRGRSDA